MSWWVSQYALHHLRMDPTWDQHGTPPAKQAITLCPASEMRLVAIHPHQNDEHRRSPWDQRPHGVPPLLSGRQPHNGWYKCMQDILRYPNLAHQGISLISSSDIDVRYHNDLRKVREPGILPRRLDTPMQLAYGQISLPRAARQDIMDILAKQS
jgi:hypothetical protein